jgi:hypothetical protein
VKLVLSVETKEKDSLMPSNGTKEMSVVLKDVLKDVLKELSERQIVILFMPISRKLYLRAIRILKEAETYKSARRQILYLMKQVV